MTLLTRKTRTATIAALAAVVPFSTVAPVGASPVRTADTTKYTSALYLQEALGLPASETSPAIQSVTYDRFQWLLQQPGQYAILIGDPATDASFKQRAQDVEQAADAAGVKDVYWFNPNLSGNAQIGSITEPNLDIRNKEGIALSSASQTKVQNPWLNVVANYLGNGASAAYVGNTFTTATSVAGASNDYGSNAGFSTKVGNTNGGALYDFSATAKPADIQESRFLIYDKDRKVLTDKASKVAAWIDLTDAPSSAATKADVATAFSSIGGGDKIDAQSEFNWWRSANNEKQAAASSTDAHGKQNPVVSDDDNKAADGGWRVHQVTYPELVFLLKSENSKDAVLLLGGTWCPNTRPVIQAVNRNAQENDVTVFNFDTILDGGTTGGNSSANPLQSRNTAGTSAGATTGLNSNPSWLYADLVKQYLGNIKTEYDPATNSTVTYYPGGDTTKPIARINRLQVPFVVSYKGKPGDATPDDGATRQWIIDDGDGTYTEYMSQYWFTRPRENQIGLSAIPNSEGNRAAIWTKLNADIRAFNWQTDPTANYANTGTDADDADFLAPNDTAKVVYASGSWTISISTNPADNPIPVSPAALQTALTALGAQAPTTLAGAKAAWIAADAASPQDPVLLANLKTVVGAFGIAQNRKNTINNTWGAANKPGSVAGGIAAIRALDVFFGGLPGGVVSKRKVTADNVVAGNAVPISIDITNDFGRTPTGNVTLVVKQGGAPTATQSVAVSGGKASFSVAGLAAGSYDFTLSYATDAQLAGFTESGSFTVNAAPTQGDQTQTPGGGTATPAQTGGTTNTAVKPVAAIKLAGTLSKAPTTKKPGKYAVKVTPAAGRAAASGTVTLTLTKGKTKKKLTGTLKNGVLSVTVPKLAKGTWKVTISWAGDANHLAASAKGASIKVKK